jgi:signal transduction histidine kinase
VVAALVAAAVTLRADFLAYPGWLALQKVDLILGPIGVGLYWCRQRPQSRFGPLLIAFGFVNVPYIFQSSSAPALFTLGVHWEGVIYLATLAVILAFPTGRLDRRLDQAILVMAAVGVVVPSSLIAIFFPQISAGGSISACKAACPDNALHVSVDPSLATRLFDFDRAAIITVALGTAALLLWRLLTGTPPQRRALAIGTPIAIVFLLTQAGYQLSLALGGSDVHLNTYLRWVFVLARSSLWYGFLFALIAAQLFAARVLTRMLVSSVARPSLRGLEELLRGPLGDPGLRFVFRDERTHEWSDGDGVPVEPPRPGSGRMLTETESEAGAVAAIMHDVQLADDPELIRAAGATALLAFENVELKGAWQESLRQLKISRARLVEASARERLRLERDLHDGAQQRLFAIQIKLAALREEVEDEEVLRELEVIADDVAAAVEECRELAHGLYPTVLRERGLADALRVLMRDGPIPVTFVDHGTERCSETVEEAVYFCVREAVQNATKHAGRGATVTVMIASEGDQLAFAVADDGRGFSAPGDGDGIGLTSMSDRIHAIGGELSIVSHPGHGTNVRGSAPMTWRVGHDSRFAEIWQRSAELRALSAERRLRSSADRAQRSAELRALSAELRSRRGAPPAGAPVTHPTISSGADETDVA